jgi:hypothetical protein
LASATLHVGGVLFQQAFVGVALHIHAQRGPGLAADQVADQPLQLGRILNAVLRLAKDGAQHTGLFAQLDQNVPVMRVQRIAVKALQALPIEIAGNQ